MSTVESPEDAAFRAEAREWLTAQLEGPFAHVRFRGGPGEEDEVFEERIDWEKAMGAAGWTGISWPVEYGGRAATLNQQVIFYQEYARAGGPGRVGHIGEGLVAPTILAFGSEEQKQRFLPGIKKWHRTVVPRIFRAGGGLRPRQRTDPRAARGRPMGDRRAEGVDLAGAQGRLVLRHLQDRA